MANVIATPETSTHFGRASGSPSVIATPPVIDTEVDSLTNAGDFTAGDSVSDTLILKGRMATSTVAGAALSIGATYDKGEANELRYTVSSWAGTGNQFNGLYLRTQSDTDNASGGLRGAEVLAVANASAVSDLKGVFSQAYIKGDTTETIATVYGLHAEVSFDASRANSVTLTEATPILSKILSGKVADYTKFHGAILRFGDMDGGARTFGDGVKLMDDADTAGTCLLTNGINLAIGATTGVLVAGATTTAVSVTGNATDAFKTATGTFTNGLNIGGTVTTGVTIGAATTGVLVTGATTTAVSVTGNATDAFKTATGTFTNGLNVGGTVTTGVTIGAATTGLAITGATTTAISISGASTNGIVLQNGENINNDTNGYISTTGGVRIAGAGGAGAASTLTFAFAETSAGAQTATFTNAPAAGNPTKYLSVWYETTKYVIPLLASS